MATAMGDWLILAMHWGLLEMITSTAYRARDAVKPSVQTSLLACMLLHSMTSLLAAEPTTSEFYRVSCPEVKIVVAGLSSEGWITWSNDAVGAAYLIERTYDLSTPHWEPIVRGVASNSIVSLKITDLAPPPGMRYLPGGMFTMGDILGDLNNATPVHMVLLSPFYLQEREVTVAQFAKVLQWAHERGKVAISGDGKAVLDSKGTNLMEYGKYNSEIVFQSGSFGVRSNHANSPAPYVSWYGAVSYCNWLSEIEGREPCYDLETWACDFTKEGYRLPTEAEWECAARGGYEGMRFPWGDTNVITHSRANYQSSTNTVYDVSPTIGLHPDYADNVPPSSPVGSFAPNNYGLYDMSGNVWEWVWDWSSRYSSAFQVNPLGPISGEFAVFRGGSWLTKAGSTTVASRYRSSRRYSTVEDVGFRTAISFQPNSSR